MHNPGDVPRVSTVALLPILHQIHAVQMHVARSTFKHSETTRLIRNNDFEILNKKLAALYADVNKLVRVELTMDPHSEG